MSRLDKIERQLEKIESKVDSKIEKKGMKFIKTIKKLFKKSQKHSEYVLVQYLTQKREVKFMVCRVVGGNVIVVNNKVHKLNPKKVWIYKKWLWYIIKEIDREPVSNEDYEKIKEDGRSTDEDVPLIKAVLGAIQKKPAMEQKNIIVILVILAVVGGILFFIFGR